MFNFARRCQFDFKLVTMIFQLAMSGSSNCSTVSLAFDVFIHLKGFATVEDIGAKIHYVVDLHFPGY